MAAILVPGIDPEFRKRWGLAEDDPGPVSGEKIRLRQKKAQPIAPPSPGWTKKKVDETLDASVDRANFRRKDFFAIPAIENRIELFKKSVPGAQNDVKAHIQGAEKSGNFLFGAEAAAAGIDEGEALLWARGAQAFQDGMNGEWPSWSDNPGDAERVKEGHRYFHQRYVDRRDR